MSFKENHNETMHDDKYAREANEKWGDTQQYEQSEEKTSRYSQERWDAILEEQDTIMKAFAQNMDKSPSDASVQELVSQWHAHITRHYYECPKEILKEIGQMYVQDQRYIENLEQYAKGTAQFLSVAIIEYCK